MERFKPKKKVCKNRTCGKEYMSERPMQMVCGLKCAAAWGAAKRVAKVKADQRVEKKAHKEALLKIRRLGDYLKDAQQAFNAYIRERDHDKPCVSCGTWNPPEKAGGAWDAGHFKTRGAFPELRFDEDNCHKQCKSCNGGSGRFSQTDRKVMENFEAELLRRIGADRLARLNGPQLPKKYTIDVLVELTRHYRAIRRDSIRARGGKVR